MNIPAVVDLLEREILWTNRPFLPFLPYSPLRIHFSLWIVAASCADKDRLLTSCYAKGIWPVVTHCHRSWGLWVFLSANGAFWLDWFVFREDRGGGHCLGSTRSKVKCCHGSIELRIERAEACCLGFWGLGNQCNGSKGELYRFFMFLLEEKMYI